MGHDLALAGVFGAVAGIEEAAADGNEGIIVFAGLRVNWRDSERRDVVGTWTRCAISTHLLRKPLPWP